MRGASRRAVVTALCVTLAVGTGTGAVAADVPERAFVVALHEDGSADVSVTYTYDLTDDGERQALRDLREDGEARDALARRFADRFRSVANASEARVGRQMSIENPRVDVVSDGDAGAVTVTVTWHGLAAVEGDELTVSEPFASEFAPDRTLSVVAPVGYTIDDASPSPDGDDGGTVSWTAGRDLSDFAVTASPDGSTGALGSGFGIVVALTGVVALAGAGALGGVGRFRTR